MITDSKQQEKDFNMAKKLAPYSFEIKNRELQELGRKNEDTERMIEIYEKIMLQERAYSKVQIYHKLSECAIIQLHKGETEEADRILKKSIEILDQMENRFPIRLENYVGNLQIILNDVKNMNSRKEKSDEVKEYIKESIKYAINIEEEARQNMTFDKVTQITETQFKLYMQTMEYYKEELLKIEKEL